MGTFRVLTLLGLCSVAGVATASFDLALVSDSGTDSIHRIDPISNVYLGSFGAGILVDPRGIAIDQALGRAYVLDATSRISTWDYNTGNFISSFTSGVTGASFMTRNSDGTLNVAGASSVARFSEAGTLVQAYARTGSEPIQQGILLSDGFFYMSTRGTSTGRLERFNYDTGAFIAAHSWFADRLTPMPNIGTANTFNVWASGGSIQLELDAFNGSPAYFGGIVSALLQNAAGVALGHGGMTYVVGRDSSNPARGGILRFDRSTYTVSPGLAGTNFIQVPTGMANVVAPEPGSLVAMAVGALMLLRRRSK